MNQHSLGRIKSSDLYILSKDIFNMAFAVSLTLKELCFTMLE